MDQLKEWLRQRHCQGLLRRLPPVERLGGGRVRLLERPPGPDELLDFSSNDYLGLSEHPALTEAASWALARWGTGSGASRLMSGNSGLVAELEAEVARLKQQPAALVFGSGYAANVGVISSLLGRHDTVFVDRLDHASIYDGCRLAAARLVRFRHNDPAHLEELLRAHPGRGRRLVVVESVYSMDGDCGPLAELVALKARYGFLLMVDEAHATGVFGRQGGGLVQESGLADQVDVTMGTFGKALGSYGAYVAAGAALIDYLVNRARSFIYSTALPPPVVAASLAAVRLVRKQPELGRELLERAALFKARLRAYGLSGEFGPSQVVPLLVGESARAVRLARALQEEGLFVTPVRPPTVPRGTARLRFSITLHHRPEDLDRAAAAVAALLAAAGKA